MLALVMVGILCCLVPGAVAGTSMKALRQRARGKPGAYGKPTGELDKERWAPAADTCKAPLGKGKWLHQNCLNDNCDRPFASENQLCLR